MTNLYLYPVKGCKPIELQSAAITPTGTFHVCATCSETVAATNLSLMHTLMSPRHQLMSPAPGFAYDRHFMIARASDGKFLSQRQLPTMSAIAVHLPPEALAGRPLLPGAALTLTAPGQPQLHVRVCLLADRRGSAACLRSAGRSFLSFADERAKSRC